LVCPPWLARALDRFYSRLNLSCPATEVSKKSFATKHQDKYLLATMVTPKSKAANVSPLAIMNRMVGVENQVLEKLVLISLAFGISWTVASNVDTTNIPIYCMLFAGFLSNTLGFRMSLYRIAGTLAKSELASANFKKMSRVQLNNAEWAPIIMLLQLAIHILSGGTPTKTGTAYCVFANVGTIWYMIGTLVFYGDVKEDNAGEGDRLPPFRFAGAVSRYSAVYLMVYECVTLIA